MVNQKHRRNRRTACSRRQIMLVSVLSLTTLFLSLMAMSCGHHPLDSDVTPSNTTTAVARGGSSNGNAQDTPNDSGSQLVAVPASIDEAAALVWDGRAAPPLPWPQLANSAEKVLGCPSANDEQKRRALYVLARAELECERDIAACQAVVDRLGRYLQQDPDDMEAQYYLGVAMLRAGAQNAATLAEYETGLRTVIEKLEASPRRRDAARKHYLLSYLAEIRGDLQVAQQEIELAIKEWPNWSGARLARALLYDKRGRSQSALRDIEFVLAHPSADTVRPITYLLQSVALSARSEYQEAESALRVGQRWFPQNAEILAMLHNLYSATGRVAAAKSTAREFYEAFPADRRAVFLMALNCLENGDMETAHRLYQSLKECESGPLDEIGCRLKLAVWLGLNKEVTVLLEKRPFRDFLPDVQWHVILMHVASGTGARRNPERAYQLLKEVKIPTVNDTGFWFMEAIRALVLAEAGEKDMAFRLIRNAMENLEERDQRARERLQELIDRLAAGDPVRWDPKRGSQQILWWPPVLQLGIRLSDGIRPFGGS